MHIKQGFPDPLVDCLWLQQVLRGVKRTQGDSSLSCIPITNDIMMVTFQALDLTHLDQCMFWAACNLAYFGFLYSEELTILNLASYFCTIHLGLDNVAVDPHLSQSYLRLQIKVLKTDPFCKGCFLHIGRGKFPLCTIHSLLEYLTLRGDASSPLFFVLRWTATVTCHTTFVVAWHLVISTCKYPRNFSSLSFRIGAAMAAAWMACWTTKFKPWDNGQACSLNCLGSFCGKLLNNSALWIHPDQCFYHMFCNGQQSWLVSPCLSWVKQRASLHQDQDLHLCNCWVLFPVICLYLHFGFSGEQSVVSVVGYEQEPVFMLFCSGWKLVLGTSWEVVWPLSTLFVSPSFFKLLGGKGVGHWRSQGCHACCMHSAWSPHGPTFIFKYHFLSSSIVDEFKLEFSHITVFLTVSHMQSTYML